MASQLDPSTVLSASPLLAPSVTPVPVAAAPAAPAVPADYTARLIAQAQQQYPFIKQYNPMVVVSPQPDGDYAETWRAGEPGGEGVMRPQSIPLDRVGIQVFRPEQFGPQDFAGEFLHVDPRANQVRSMFMQTLSPEQLQKIQNSSKDYLRTINDIKPDMPPEEAQKIRQQATQDAIDSAFRGYTVGQWPAEANASIGYTPEQLQLLDGLKRYMTTGAQ
jgi:hypothetical protein